MELVKVLLTSRTSGELEKNSKLVVVPIECFPRFAE